MSTTTAPTNVQALPQDATAPATMFDPELTYYADGTSVTMTWTGGQRNGVARGMSGASSHGVYAYQVVEWADGTFDKVAPHVLSRTVAEPETLAQESVTAADGAVYTQTMTPKAATGNGDLDGFLMACTCGNRHSLSLRTMANQYFREHMAWHARKPRRTR